MKLYERRRSPPAINTAYEPRPPAVAEIEKNAGASWINSLHAETALGDMRLS